jgi:hypothetical protein
MHPDNSADAASENSLLAKVSFVMRGGSGLFPLPSVVWCHRATAAGY